VVNARSSRATCISARGIAETRTSLYSAKHFAMRIIGRPERLPRWPAFTATNPVLLDIGDTIAPHPQLSAERFKELSH